MGQLAFSSLGPDASIQSIVASQSLQLQPVATSSIGRATTTQRACQILPKAAVQDFPITSAVLFAIACTAFRQPSKPSRRKARTIRCALNVERNRGLDPKRLLDTMRQVGIGSPRRPALPSVAESLRANSRDAAMLLMEERKKSVQEGRDGLRPSLSRKDYRLPLLVKYHKPPGVVSTMRAKYSGGREDLRSVVAMGGDKFELDLYHPVGTLSSKASGLILWSRSGRITKSLVDRGRGVVYDFELDLVGDADGDELGEQLRDGVPLGVVGFQRKGHGDVRQAVRLPDSEDGPRTRVIVATRDSRTQVRGLVQGCGYKVKKIKRVGVGLLSLGQLPEGDLTAASYEEEVWACQLAGLPETDYPPAPVLPTEKAAGRGAGRTVAE